MTRDEALKLVKSRVKNKNLVKHMIAVGAAMRSFASILDGDSEKWELAGILHDIDYDKTVNDFPKHGLVSYEELIEIGIDEDIASAVRAHPAHKDFMPKTKMEWALHIIDPATGLIVAATLMHPSKKITEVDTEFVMRRFGEKRFAAGANREQMKLCEEKLGIPLDNYLGIVLKAMQSVSKEIGL